MYLYVFDASSILNLTKRGLAKIFMNGSTLNLAYYESLNAVWKEFALLKRIDEETALEYVRVLDMVFEALEKEDIEGYEMDIFRLASNEGLTVYDASYLFLAIRRRSTLVTDDDELQDKASKYVKVMSSAQIAENSG
ncbi:type II toxin-antitoxin system VapC family toxin [Conexivisphaera calida]|uniref:type II toxin-antitoxin system VapC family toxin n=1 Tax=Conexivisphaera calida TaxID=1874277 RepID=UPI001E2B23AB|nr:type II toxin-antitoxin system VapC family toxin [Conexivisphaera calida]